MIGKPPRAPVGDLPAINFLNTRIQLPDDTWDFIDDSECLLSWMRQANLLDDAAVASIKTHSTRADLNHIAKQVRELREWFRAAVHWRQENPTADASHIAHRLNAILRTDDAFSVLRPGNTSAGMPIQLQVVRRDASETAILVRIAEMLARFLCAESLEHIKICADGGCQIMFKDLAAAATPRHVGPSPRAADDRHVPAQGH